MLQGSLAELCLYACLFADVEGVVGVCGVGVCAFRACGWHASFVSWVSTGIVHGRVFGAVQFFGSGDRIRVCACDVAVV